jgi:two-component system response regulator YesN
MRLETVFSNEHYTIERRENRILALVDERERQNLETRDFHGKLCLVFSAPCFQAFDFAEGYRQARTACFYRFFRDDSVFHYRKPERDIDRVPGHARLQELQDLVEHLRFFPSQAITERVNALFSFGGSGGSQGEYLALLHEYFILHITNLYREHIADNMYLTLTMKMLADAPCFSSLEDFKKRIVNIMLCLNQRFRKNSSRYAFIDAALDWIHQHFTENINMSLTANQVSVNYTYFSEKFKEHTGSNFNEYLKMLRIAKAKKLLKQGFYKVYEVAQRSGYNDVKYFLKSFKEITGVSPGEYQRAANHESSNP